MFNIPSFIVRINFRRVMIAICANITCLFSGHMFADDLDYDAVHAGLARINPQIQAQSIDPISIDGMVRVLMSTGEILYMTEDGEHFFVGSFFRNAENEKLVNITESDQKMSRAQLLNSEAAQKAWVFPAVGETRGAVTVFTDVDCYYCQKLHSEIEVINDLGIEVRYLAFPRAGIGSSSHQILVDAWCAPNPNEFMTEAKRRAHNQQSPQKSPTFCDNPVADHYALSQQMALKGTPAILLEDGTLWPGYLPAATLAQRLGIQ